MSRFNNDDFPAFGIPIIEMRAKREVCGQRTVGSNRSAVSGITFVFGPSSESVGS